MATERPQIAPQANSERGHHQTADPINGRLRPILALLRVSTPARVSVGSYTPSRHRPQAEATRSPRRPQTPRRNRTSTAATPTSISAAASTSTTGTCSHPRADHLISTSLLKIIRPPTTPRPRPTGLPITSLTAETSSFSLIPKPIERARRAPDTTTSFLPITSHFSPQPLAKITT